MKPRNTDHACQDEYLANLPVLSFMAGNLQPSVGATFATGAAAIVLVFQR